MSLKIDIANLCELVQSRPCLWDEKDPKFRDRILRENSWEEIFKFLDDEYEGKTTVQKKETGNHSFPYVFIQIHY